MSMPLRLIGGRSPRLLLLLVLVPCLCACQVSLGQLSDRPPEPEPDLDIGYGEETLTVEELRAAIVAFSARFYGAVGPTFNELARSSEDAHERVLASRARFYMLASATDIATSESPAAALLDMVVFVRVSRMSWQTRGIESWGEAARPIVRALTTMEEDVWALAARVLSPQQRQELEELIDE